VGAFQVFVLGKSALAAYHCMQHMEPFEHFKDASSGLACFGLTVRSCIEVTPHPATPPPPHPPTPQTRSFDARASLGSQGGLGAKRSTPPPTSPTQLVM